MSSRPSSRSESTAVAMKLFVIEQMRNAVSAPGASPDSSVAHAAPAGVQELAVERDAVGEARRAELAERGGEELVDGRSEGADARGALGIAEGVIHDRGS